MPTDKEIGKALKQTREKYSRERRHLFAAKLGEGDWILRDRENGRVPLRVSEVIDYAKVLGVSPIALFAELLSNCDRDYWQDIAKQLDCTVPMAKQRLAEAQKQHNLTHGQVWRMYLERQIRL